MPTHRLGPAATGPGVPWIILGGLFEVPLGGKSREKRLLNELLRIIGPELASLADSLDDVFDEFASRRAPSDVDVENGGRSRRAAPAIAVAQARFANA